MPVCQNKFWIFRLQDLFCEYTLVPKKNMSLEKKMNTLTRDIIILFLILYILNVKNIGWYFIISILIIIILYFIQKNKMIQENYEQPFLNSMMMKPNQYTTKKVEKTYLTNMDIERDVMSQKNNLAAYMERQGRYCDNSKYLPLNETQVFKERALSGPPNPETNFNLYIEPRPADIFYWRDNQYVNYDKLNVYKPDSLYDSGYIPRQFESKPLFDVSQYFDEDPFKKTGQDDYFVVERNFKEPAYKNSFEKELKQIDKEFPIKQIPIKENYEKIEKKAPLKEEYAYSNIYQNYQQDEQSVPDFYYSAGVNTDNTKYNLPINYPATPLEMRDKQKPLNNEVFTLRLTPTLANQYEVVYPNNSNISVSTVLPKREQISRDENGKTIYTSAPPMNDNRNIIKNPFKGDPTVDSMYDSKTVGYGPSYRSYYEPISGTMRYYYDDIDVVKHGAIMTDNKIDIFEGSMNKMGLMPGSLFDLNTMKKIEQNRFLDMTSMHRESMQSSLMEYVGDREWQTKHAPTYSSI